MDFINGKADPWGMKVNPSYKKLTLPRVGVAAARHLHPDHQQQLPPDTTRRSTSPSWPHRSPPCARSSDALLDAWPNVQTRCDSDLATSSYKLGRIDRQSYGSRFMLGVVSLGDAARYGLHTAALQTKKGTFVAPDEESLAAAVDLMQPQEPSKGGKGHQGGESRRGSGEPGLSELGRPFVLDQADIRTSGKAYPGTMVVYAAAKLRNLVQDDADKVALFIRTATTEGQKAGAGNGELPAGFLPIEKKGATRKLFDLAQSVGDGGRGADARSRRSEPAPSDTSAPTLPPNTGGSGDPGDVGDVPGGDVPTDSPSAAPSPPATAPAEPLAMPATEAVSSDLGDRAVPVLLILGLIGIALTSAVRFFVRPPRGPLR